MNDSRSTAFVLRLCVCIGIAVIVIGLLTDSTDILWFGILALICAPFLGILTTFVSLISEKDWYWVKVAAVLIVVMAIGITISIIQ